MKKDFLTALILIFTSNTLIHASTTQESSTTGLPLGLWVSIGIFVVLIILALYTKKSGGEKDTGNIDNEDSIEPEAKSLARVQHYEFAHVVLKDMFFENPNKLTRTVLCSEGELRALWYDVGEFCAKNYEGVEKLDGSDIEITAKEFEDKLFIIITLPEPKERTEVYFIGLIVPKNYNELARYITLEYGVEQDMDPFTVLCEWEKGIHLNRGESVKPTINVFKDLIISLGDVSVQTWDEAKPVYDSADKLIKLWEWADAHDISPLTLPRNSKDIMKIKELSLSFLNLNIEYLPKEIGYLTNLEVFALQDSSLKELPREFGNLINLQLLYIDGNKLTQLPDEFCNLVNLRRFFAGENQLIKLPDCMGNLKELEVLNIYGNKLTALPDSIAELTYLKELEISNNHITEISDAIENLPNLEHVISL